MINQGPTNSEELQIQGLIDRFLKFRSSDATSEAHLDEDSLNAFVEGTLSRRELSPVIKHLTDCSFCLNVTAELAKLEMAFAEQEAPIAAEVPEPTKVSDVLSGLLSRIFGMQDVFAHEEKKEEPEADKADKKDEE